MGSYILLEFNGETPHSKTWAGVAASGVAEDMTWFVWLTPGTAQQLTVEGACGFTRILL